jgi:hypothetical protein
MMHQFFESHGECEGYLRYGRQKNSKPIPMQTIQIFCESAAGRILTRKRAAHWKQRIV